MKTWKRKQVKYIYSAKETASVFSLSIMWLTRHSLWAKQTNKRRRKTAKILKNK